MYSLSPTQIENMLPDPVSVCLSVCLSGQQKMVIMQINRRPRKTSPRISLFGPLNASLVLIRYSPKLHAKPCARSPLPHPKMHPKTVQSLLRRTFAKKIITPQKSRSNDETPFFCGEFPSEMLWQLHDRPNGLRMLASLSSLRKWRMGMTVVFND